jgi:hypothetical protein
MMTILRRVTCFQETLGYSVLWRMRNLENYHSAKIEHTVTLSRI